MRPFIFWDFQMNENEFNSNPEYFSKRDGKKANHPVEMPHDYLSEKSLLSCLIIDGNSFDSISDLKLNREDFYNPQYGVVFDAIKDLYFLGRPVDYVTVCSRLLENGKLDLLGGTEFILQITEENISAVNVAHYGRSVKEKSSIREIIRTAQRVIDKGMNFTGTTSDFIQDVEQSFFKLTNEAKSGGLNKLSVALKKNLKDLEDTSRKPGELSGLTSGYEEIDTLLMGMQPGQLIVLAARPGMGKTSLGLNILQRSVEASGLPGVIFSLEMLEHELSLKLLAAKGKIDLKKMKTKDFTQTDLRGIGAAYQQLGQQPIYINDSGSTTVLDIISRCRKIKSEQGLGLVMVDYLQLLRATSDVSREQQISEMSRGLKAMAKELECPVIALSQLNRGVESRVDKRPSTADLRESGAIEQDADVVMMIYRDDYYNKDSKEPGVAEIIVCKNRAGETGVAKLSWVGAYTTFENLSYRPDA